MKLVVSVVLVLSIYLLKIDTVKGEIGNTFHYHTLQALKVVQHFESGKCLNVYVREINEDHNGYGKFTDTDKKLSGGSSSPDWEKWWPTGGSKSEILKVHLGECPGKSEKSTVLYDGDDSEGDHHGVEANDVNFTPFDTQVFHLQSSTPDMLDGCVYADAQNFYIVEANKCDPKNPIMLFSLIPIPGQIDTHQIIHTASGLCFQISNPLDAAVARLSTCDAEDTLQWWTICDLSGHCSWSPSPPDEANEPAGPGEQKSTRKTRSTRIKRSGGSDGLQGPPGYPGTPGGSGASGGQGGTGGAGGPGNYAGGSGGSGGSGGPGGSGGECGRGGQGAPGGNGGAAGPPAIGGCPGTPGSPGLPGNPGSTGAPGAAGEPGTPGGHGLAGGPGASGGPGGPGGIGGAGGACTRGPNP